jgi:hypothetical protein
MVEVIQKISNRTFYLLRKVSRFMANADPSAQFSVTYDAGVLMLSRAWP